MSERRGSRKKNRNERKKRQKRKQRKKLSISTSGSKEKKRQSSENISKTFEKILLRSLSLFEQKTAYIYGEAGAREG